VEPQLVHHLAPLPLVVAVAESVSGAMLAPALLPPHLLGRQLELCQARVAEQLVTPSRETWVHQCQLELASLLLLHPPR